MKPSLSHMLRYKPLIALVFLAACAKDTPFAPGGPTATPGTPSSTWVSPQPCQIGLPDYDPWYYYTLIPTSSTVCGVGWSMYFPPNNDLYRGIYWFPDDPAPAPMTLFSSGYYAPWGLYGPIEITLNGAVKDFSLVLESKERTFWPEYTVFPLRSGHYMVALDAAGQRLDSVSFDANVMVSEKTLRVQGIRKVLLYPVIKRYDGAAPIPDEVVYRASFATMPAGELKCKSPAGTDTVTRGQTVTCTVTGAGVVVTKWTFTGPSYDGSIIWRVEDATPSGNSWKGPAVMSGDVTAEVTINGRPHSPLTAKLTVKRRTGNNWSWGPGNHWGYSTVTLGSAPCPFLGTMLYSFTDTTVAGQSFRKSYCDTDVLTPRPSKDSTTGYSVKQVPAGGPNAGIWYVSGISYQMLTWSMVNPAITSGSSVSYALTAQADLDRCRAGTGKTITKANFYFYNKNCGKVNVDYFISTIFLHEGRGCCSGNGHQAQLEIAANEAAHMLYERNEGDLALDQVTARRLVYSDAKAINAKLNARWASHMNVKGNISMVIWGWYRVDNKFYSRLYQD
jgi:hypothetical protein